MKLNIYNKKEIVKTYEVETSDLMFGTVEDISQVLDIRPDTKITNEKLIELATEFIGTRMDEVKTHLKDIFDGLTDDELRHARMSEFVTVITEVVAFTLGALGKGNNEKN